MHERIREYCPWNRQYNSREEMTEDIIKRLNEQIPEDGVLLLLGDLSLNHNEAVKAINQFKFKVRISPGNHDKISIVNKKGWSKSREMMLQSCPNILDIKDRFVFNLAGRPALFNHFPWADFNDERHDLKYMELRPRKEDFPGIEWCIAGHVHSRPEQRINRDKKWIDVGWDPWGRAVTFEELEEIINDRT
jgi:calcineurin-like phosphoesterase family protein